VTTAHLPGNPRRSGYRLCEVATDWREFQQHADEAAQLTGPAAHEARARALVLVRGVPFESELSRWFQWTDTEGIRTAITRAVVAVSIDAHAERVQAGDLDAAEWALRQGLRCHPLELSLWACLADVVQARGDRNDEERFWRDATATLGTYDVIVLRQRVAG
jgi:hypothetical protein